MNDLLCFFSSFECVGGVGGGGRDMNGFVGQFLPSRQSESPLFETLTR